MHNLVSSNSDQTSKFVLRWTLETFSNEFTTNEYQMRQPLQHFVSGGHAFQKIQIKSDSLCRLLAFSSFIS